MPAWPRRAGRFPDPLEQQLRGQAVDRFGATAETVATAFRIERDSARKTITVGRRLHVTTATHWRVTVASGELAAFLLNVPVDQIACEPDHPESDRVQLLALTPDWPVDSHDALRRATHAIRLGDDERRLACD